MSTINEALDKLNKSKFRSSFKLNKKDIQYIDDKGLEKIEEHAYDFVNQKLKIKLLNDGKQTPYKGHPVFKAMHATACCCRGCLNKWYNVDLDKDLTEEDIKRIVNLLISWIKKQLNN